MERSSWAQEGLAGAVDAVVLGLFIMLGSLLVVTAPAAIAAAVNVMSQPAPAMPIRTCSIAAYRQRVGLGSLLGAALLVLLAVGVAYVLWATREPLSPVSTAVLASGVLVLLSAFAFGGAGTVQLVAHTFPHRPGQSFLAATVWSLAMAPGKTYLTPSARYGQPLP